MVLKHLDGDEAEEIVKAKFVVGADGILSFHRTPIPYSQRFRCPFVGPKAYRDPNGGRKYRSVSSYSIRTADNSAYLDYIWGVVDMIPDSNFPDIRNKTAIHSPTGSSMIIPREGDMIRLYIQLSDKQVIDPATGRVDKSRMTADDLLGVSSIISSLDVI